MSDATTIAPEPRMLIDGTFVEAATDKAAGTAEPTPYDAIGQGADRSAEGMQRPLCAARRASVRGRRSLRRRQGTRRRQDGAGFDRYVEIRSLARPSA